MGVASVVGTEAGIGREEPADLVALFTSKKSQTSDSISHEPVRPKGDRVDVLCVSTGFFVCVIDMAVAL